MCIHYHDMNAVFTFYTQHDKKNAEFDAKLRFLNSLEIKQNEPFRTKSKTFLL